MFYAGQHHLPRLLGDCHLDTDEQASLSQVTTYLDISIISTISTHLRSRQEMALFQGLRQGDGPNMEKAPLGDNLRPRYTYIMSIYNIYNLIIYRQPLNNRAVRTNIALQGQKVGIMLRWIYC